MQPDKFDNINLSRFNPWRFLISPSDDIRPLTDFHVTDFTYIVPECFLFSSLLLLLLVGSFKFKNIKNYTNVVTTGGVLTLILGITTILLCDNFIKNNNQLIFYDFLTVDNFSTFAKMCITTLTIFLLISSKKYAEYNKLREYDYLLVLGFTTGGLMIALSVNDFMALLLSIELVSYGLYTLANIKKNSAYATEAAAKYYITGILATGLYAFGASMFYLQTKTLNFFTFQLYMYNEKDIGNGKIYNEILNYMDFSGPNYFLLIFGIVMMIVLLLFKIAAAPFHVWSPDVYEGVPMIITAYYATIVKFTMMLIFLKTIRFVLSDFIHVLRPGLIFIAVISLLVGSIGAAYQDKLKRVFAYSSISHVGYIVAGLIPFTDTGITASLVYIFIYTVGNVILFNFLLSTNVIIEEKEVAGTVVISDLAKIGKSSPLLSGFFSCALFSFAGIPPFAGFFAKLGIFYALAERGYSFIILIGFISTAISCFYYLKMIKALFFVSVNSKITLPLRDTSKEVIMFWFTVCITFYIFFARITMVYTKILFLSYFSLFSQW